MDIMIPEVDEIVNFYTPEKVEQAARETGFVERESKFGGIEFLGIMTAGLFSKPDASLSQMAGMAKDINPESEISAAGIHQRINEAGVEFLKELLSEALEISISGEMDESIPGPLESFERVCLLDSTIIELPDSLSAIWKGSGGTGSEAVMKLQLMLDYKSGEYMNVTPTDGVTPDQSYAKEAVKLLSSRDLVMFDLGYFSQKALFDISAAGAYFLCRLNHQVSLYRRDEDGTLTRFDLVKELGRNLKAGIGACELELWLSKGETVLKVRLIAERVPDSVANERRRKARQKAKRKNRPSPSARYLFLLGWSLYITNVGKEILKAESVSLVYRLRWQIELVFKAWKSYHGLEELRGERLERIECFIYGRLIMMVIMAFLSGSIRRHLWKTRRRELSFLRVVRHFQLKAYKALPFIGDPVSLARFLKDEFLEACRLCMMDSRKRLSTAGKIRMTDAFSP
jgi:hypothetical protein